MEWGPGIRGQRPARTRLGRFMTWVFVLQLILLGLSASAVAAGWYRTIDVFQSESVVLAVQVAVFLLTFVMIVWGRKIGLKYGMSFIALLFGAVFAGTLGSGRSIFFFVFGIYVGMVFGGMLDAIYVIRDDKKHGFDM